MNCEETNSAGFGTLEALIAFLILSMMLGGAVQLISGSAGLLKRSQELNNSRMLLNQVAATVLPNLNRYQAGSGKAQNGYRLIIDGLTGTANDAPTTEGGRLVAVRIKTEGRSSKEFLTFQFIDSDVGE